MENGSENRSAIKFKLANMNKGVDSSSQPLYSLRWKCGLTTAATDRFVDAFKYKYKYSCLIAKKQVKVVGVDSAI